MNLIVSSITIVDLTNKEAKRISFSPQKNLLTSVQNHLGKSIVMKSIYYTLGAEVYFSNTIKKTNLLTYMDFELDKQKYRICRFKYDFTLYSNGVFVSHFSSVADFEEKLCDMFDLEINLVGKDESGTIVKCPPAFYFLPYYIDQENGWSTNSYSFNNITMFDLPQRKNSYFFHLGVFDKNYVEISKRKKANDRLKGKLEKDNEKYITVIETLRNGLDDMELSFDIQTLERNISTRQQEITILLDNIAKVRKDLVETEDQLVQLEQEKAILSKLIKSKKPLTSIDENEILECPRCGMHFERSVSNKLEKLYLLESINDDYANISTEQKKLKRRIEKLHSSFVDKQKILESFEKNLANDKEEYDAYIKSKATNQLLKEYREKVGENISEIERLNKDTTEINKQIKIYTDEKTKANQAYSSNFNKLSINLDIPKEQIGENIEPGSSVSASGAYGPRCKIAQMLAFVQTQKKLNNKTISFPLVIDSPNALEQDKSHLATVMKTLMTWDKTDNQIIVASIEGKDIASSIDGVNIIELNNPQDHLLNQQEYILHENEISEIFMKF